MSIKTKLAVIVLITITPMAAACAYFAAMSMSSLRALDSADRAVQSIHSLAQLRLFTNRLAASEIAHAGSGSAPDRESAAYSDSARSALRSFEALRGDAKDGDGGRSGAAEAFSSLAGLLGSARAGPAAGGAAIEGAISDAIEKFTKETGSAMSGEKARAEKSYGTLQTSLGSLPWASGRATELLEFARASIGYFLAAERTCSSIARQAREARAIASGRAASRAEYDRLGCLASQCLDDWRSAAEAHAGQGAEGEPKDLQNALDVARKYEETVRSMSEALESARAGDGEGALRFMDSRVAPVVDEYILPKISKAYDEYRKDAYDSHNGVRDLLAGGMAGGIAVLGAISLAAVFIALALMRGIMKSVGALEAGSRAIGSGDLGHRIGISPGDELGRLAQAFNRMAEDLQKITVSRDYLRSLASEITLAGERERRDIAGVLHDDLGQKLALLKIRLGMLCGAAGGTRGEAESVMGLIDEVIAATRSLTSDLSPPVLYELGYAAAVEWIGEKAGRENGFEVECDVADAGPEPSMDVKVLLFQSVREALRNVAKHASARRVSIRVAGADGRIVTRIEDDGAGFDPAAAEDGARRGGHFGLFSIRERLGRIGGSLAVDSGPGRGTRITLTAPL